MGVFDSTCTESGLIIDGEQRLVLIAETGGAWHPIGLPIAGTTNRYGTMDEPDKIDANIAAIVAFGKTLSYRDDRVKPAKVDLAAMLDEIRGDGSGATLGATPISFALVDGPIYDAIVATVKKDGADAWTRYARLGLETQEPPLPGREPEPARDPPPIDATARRLCEAILASPEDRDPRKVYVDYLLERDDPRGKLLAALPALKKAAVDDLLALALPGSTIYATADRAKLRDAVVEIVRFRAWGTTWISACGEGQFFGYESDDDDESDSMTKAYSDRARAKYAGMKKLLAAIAANEKAWRARQAEDDDDDDED